MLTKWRAYLLSILAVALVGGSLAASPTAAFADGIYCNPVTKICYTVIDQPGTDPIASPDPKTGFTPGPTACSFENFEGQNVEVACRTTSGPWSNSKACYIAIMPTQNPAPPGADPAGAWYWCAEVPPDRCGIRDCFTVSWWSDTPPPGIDTLTPGQAAARLISTFQLAGVNIGFAPNPNIPSAKSYVGVPIWMWVNNPTPLTYGPYTEIATLGGQIITATAQVTSILWNMGDGTTVPCGSPGTEFKVAYGATDSPTCGYRYSTTSDDQAGGRFNVTATSQWSVTWSGGGQNGTIPLAATSNTTVDINELQAVNVDD